MDLIWKIEDSDIERLSEFVNQNDNPLVQNRISRNIHRIGLTIDKDLLLKAIMMCLLTSQQRSGPKSPVGRFLVKNPFPFNYQDVSHCKDLNSYTREILKVNGLTRYINKISHFFELNFAILAKSDFEVIKMIKDELSEHANRTTERKIADYIDNMFIGFGPKQARNLLQTLGYTKYEIPIDSRIIKWMNNFGFPVELSSDGLQDRHYYHFVSEGIQHLCEKANVYPCVLDAAIFSYYDEGEWTEENVIY